MLVTTSCWASFFVFIIRAIMSVGNDTIVTKDFQYRIIINSPKGLNNGNISHFCSPTIMLYDLIPKKTIIKHPASAVATLINVSNSPHTTFLYSVRKASINQSSKTGPPCAQSKAFAASWFGGGSLAKGSSCA